jgi:pyruvate carboxylase
MGVHALAIKDMAGLLTPESSTLLVGRLRQEWPDIPLHIHTHDTAGTGVASMLAAAAAGADIVDAAIDAMSGLTSQPSLGAIAASLRNGQTNIDLDALQLLNRYWEDVRYLYSPFESGQLSGSSDVFSHEIPGGQYTNLLFQSKQLGLSGRFAEIKKAYSQANELLGDIPKVTPSSKVVGDLAQFMVSQGLSPSDVLEQAGNLPLPNSVVEYFQGCLGSPPGGFPEPLRSRVLEGKSLPDGRLCFDERPGAQLEPYDFDEATQQLQSVYGVERITFKDVLSHALYPEVFREWLLYEEIYGPMDPLPTHVFLRPMQVNDEVNFAVEKGRRIFLKLASISDVDPSSGSRQVTFEANGERWFIRTTDEKNNDSNNGAALTGSPRREKADPLNDEHISAPFTGVIVDVKGKVSENIIEGDTLFVLSAMKMETAIQSLKSGVVKRVLVNPGDQVSGGDLLAIVCDPGDVTNEK